MYEQKLHLSSVLILLTALIVFAGLVSVSYGSQNPSAGPQVIKDDISCGKCGMFPAKYPKWQTQIIFTDGTMAPFDGCKCMFGFLFQMDQYDKNHASADVASIWVREFGSGDWINAREAHYVIGSDEMGPMGKELIPFAHVSTAETFQKEHGGQISLFDSISMETLKPLMGKMKMKGQMKGKMQM